jgi:hypothetical protein
MKIELFSDMPAEPETETTSSAEAPALPRFNPANMAAKAEEQLNAIENEVKNELKPKGFIQLTQANDWAFGQWEKDQYRGFSTSLVRQKMQPALQNILTQLLAATEPHESASLQARKLSKGWLSNRKDQIRVEEILAQFNLDERCIEAEAWRLCSADAILLQRMSTSAMNLQDKALTNFANYRDALETQPVPLQNIEAEEVPLNKSQLS